MAELRACKKCQLVNKKVELFYHEAKWMGTEYLCQACQKNAFHFWIKMMLIAIFSEKDQSKKKEMLDNFRTRTETLAKKNKITEKYWMKAIEHEVKLATGKQT